MTPHALRITRHASGVRHLGCGVQRRRNMPLAMCRRVLAVCLLLVAQTAVFATKYAGDFEELGVSARSVGMGSAFVAVGADPAAMYYNPSASALLDRRSVMLMHAGNFQGLVKSDFGALVLPGAGASIGFGLLRNGVDGIKLTRLLNETLPIGAEFVYTRDTMIEGDSVTLTDTLLNMPVVDRMVNAADWVFYFNYSRRLSSRFLLGGNAKLIYRTTGVSTCYGMGLDLGATAILAKDFNLGLRVRNLSTSPLFWDTKTQESVLPRIALGIGRGFTLGQRDKLLLEIDVEGNFEGLPVEENLGLEYSLRNTLLGRIGFHRGNFTFGLGGQYKQFFVDYAYETAPYSDARELGASQKIAGGIRF